MSKWKFTNCWAINCGVLDFWDLQKISVCPLWCLDVYGLKGCFNDKLRSLSLSHTQKATSKNWDSSSNLPGRPCTQQKYEFCSMMRWNCKVSLINWTSDKLPAFLWVVSNQVRSSTLRSGQIYPNLIHRVSDIVLPMNAYLSWTPPKKHWHKLNQNNHWCRSQMQKLFTWWWRL